MGVALGLIASPKQSAGKLVIVNRAGDTADSGEFIQCRLLMKSLRKCVKRWSMH